MGYILLIEDNQVSADMTLRILTTAGFEVKHALRGLDGARLARLERPALILMDFDLPDINGRTLALVMKHQLGDRHGPPIVAVTARTSSEEKWLAGQFGCSAFIAKPYDPNELLDVVHKLLNSANSGD